jgi:hypothetical protein
MRKICKYSLKNPVMWGVVAEQTVGLPHGAQVLGVGIGDVPYLVAIADDGAVLETRTYWTKVVGSPADEITFAGSGGMGGTARYVGSYKAGPRDFEQEYYVFEKLPSAYL